MTSKRCLWLLMPLVALATPLSLIGAAETPSMAAAREIAQTYGCPWNADSLANLEIGRLAGRMVSYRFCAKYSGKVKQVMIFLIFRAPGYYKGDGGQVLLQLQTDDDSAAHLPSGTVLASSLVNDPTKQWNRLFVLDRPAPVEAGRLYHLVFTNPAPDPINNYVSVDDLHSARREPQMQPAVNDRDLAVLFKRSAQLPWAINYGHTPIFCLSLADGSRQGQGYTDALSSSGRCTVAGASRVREVFRVSGASRTVTELRVRLRKQGQPGDLIVRLQTAEGALVASGAIPTASVRDSHNWVACKFAKPCDLKSGRSYHLELSAPPGDPYELFPIQEGAQAGFDCPELFSDGHFEFTTGSSWECPRGKDRKDFDMQFYFLVTGSRESP